MALISQECGASLLASLGLNAMAPDEGNMHTLLIAGTAAQLTEYLGPLAEGRVRSCFAMTEPDVASSDPTNLQTTAIRDGADWVINGRKWCITGAEGAAFGLVVAKTGADRGAGHPNYSLILVPTDAPGWAVERDPGWIGVSQRALDMTAERLLARRPCPTSLGERSKTNRARWTHCTWPCVRAARPAQASIRPAGHNSRLCPAVKVLLENLPGGRDAHRRCSRAACSERFAARP